MKILTRGSCGLFKGSNARAAALKWANEKSGRTAYFNHGKKIYSTNGRAVSEGWTDGTDQGGNWWLENMSVRERMSMI